MHRRTPCVGICSTTYGDLVCRGCKRFAHEIVGWNGFSDDQRRAVWLRLQALRDGAVATYLTVVDPALLRDRAAALAVSAEGDFALAYEVLVRRRIPMAELAADGLQPLPSADVASTRDLVRLIDQEFYARAQAHYERNFRIAAD